MEKIFVDEESMKNSRVVLCPGCDNEVQAGVDDEEVRCSGCGECSEPGPEGSYPEEFVWHPRRKF